MPDKKEAKEALDTLIKKSRVHLYKPIQIAEILYGVTCTFHSNISPCVNLKNLRFSDFTGALLSFIKK